METKSTKPAAREFRKSALSTGRWLGAVMITGLLVLVSGGSARGQNRELHDLSTQLAQKIASSGKKSVAVVDFTDLQGNVTELGRFLAEELSDSLAEQANGFRVIDRTYLKAILREHKLDSTGLIDPATASKLGQISGVQGLITGTIVPLGDNVSLSVKVLDAATEAIITATMVQIPRTPTINGLLNKGISGSSSGNSSTPQAGGTESEQQQGTTPAVQPKGVMVVHEEDVDFMAKGCRRDRGRVVCFGSVTDKASSELNFAVQAAYVLDNLGNQSQIDLFRQFVLGARGYSQQLEPDLPMNFSVWADLGSQGTGGNAGGGGIGGIIGAVTRANGSSGGINPSATSVSIVLKGSYSGQRVGYRTYTVTLRHIPIKGR